MLKSLHGNAVNGLWTHGRHTCMSVRFEVAEQQHQHQVYDGACALRYDLPNGFTYLQLGRDFINHFLFKYMAF